MVIGLAAGLAYAHFETDPRHTVERESQRLAAALEHAALLAQWKDETLGVSASGNAYRFWRQLRRRLDMAADVDRRRPCSRASCPRRSASRRASMRDCRLPANAILPLRASGRNEPYVIQITSPEWFTLLAADPLNRVALTGPTPR